MELWPFGLKRRGWIVGAVEEELAKRPVRAPHGRREKSQHSLRSSNLKAEV